MFQESLGRRRRKKTQSKRIFDRDFKTNRRAEALWKYCMQTFHFHILRSLSHWEVYVSHKNCEGRRLQSDRPPGRPPQFRFYVLITPLLGSCLGRQGSSGSGSWAKTESSPEEQVLLESWQVGEYCSKGTARSRYSCQGRGQRLR